MNLKYIANTFANAVGGIFHRRRSIGVVRICRKEAEMIDFDNDNDPMSDPIACMDFALESLDMAMKYLRRLPTANAERYVITIDNMMRGISADMDEIEFALDLQAKHWEFHGTQPEEV